MIATKSLFTTQELEYDYDALEPAISRRMLTLHHDKHYQGYVDTLNRLIENTPYANMSLEEIVNQAEGNIFNNAAQAWNHEFYFAQFSHTPQPMPGERLLEALGRSFGSFEYFRATVLEAATSLFGSGWVWLVADSKDDLALIRESNAGNPMGRGYRPMLTIDVWEHAYYVDYENRRAEAVRALWSIIDWHVIDRRY
ncbi:MAG: superoxide dismutase [Rikenellaceae bacterium]